MALTGTPPGDGTIESGILRGPAPTGVPPDVAEAHSGAEFWGESPVLAAGAVLWRPGTDGEPEVALVHRPRYDDWSLPKGKLDPAEHPLSGAAREVAEETGQDVALGRPLPTQHYEAFGRPKEVRYWAGRALGGEFVPNDEVDELAWLSVADAKARLTRSLDVDVLDAFTAAPVDTTPLLVLRHGATVKRAKWDGPDFERPCDARGLEQAAALVPVLSALGVRRLVSSPMRRCLQTVQPFATAAGIAVETLAGLAEEASPADATVARAAVRSLAACGGPLVVCTHGPVLPPLFDSLHAATGATQPSRPLRKAEFVVLHLTDGRAVATELHRP